MKNKLLVVIVSLLVLAAVVLPGPVLQASPGLFQSPPPGLPNDDFDSATAIGALPYSDSLDTSQATWASDDPGDCGSNGSVWYVFTPSADAVIEANTFGSLYDTVLSAYTGSRGALVLVGGACNDDYYGTESRIRFQAVAGTTYYFLVGNCCGTGGNGGGSLLFNVQEGASPPNDNFVNALQFSALPFSDGPVDISTASVEMGEPRPSCVETSSWGRTVWYAYTPAETASVTTRTESWSSTGLAAYTGNSVASLTEVGSRCWGGRLTFQAEAGTTYYLQLGDMGSSDQSWLMFYLEVTPPPVADFYFYPSDPSVFDSTWFGDSSYDPANNGIASVQWDFGDGTASTDWNPNHTYAADGDYSVQLTVTTVDGRTASVTKTVPVRTHDVAITKFTVPTAASSGQTRSILVGLNSKRYLERVEVTLWKSVPGGQEWIGSLIQSVPVRPANRTTDFKFSYTFTAEDAAIGKVTFKAVAVLVDARDALPADNEAIAMPTKVSR